MRMNTSSNSTEMKWQLIADRHFEDFDQFRDSIRGWDFELQQLTPGRSSIDLLQLGRPEFMLTRFYFEQSYDQGGIAPPGTLTFGLCEDGVDRVITPDGMVQHDGILCFPSNQELDAVSQRDFKGYSLSVSESLIAEVAESSGLGSVAANSNKVQQVLRCDSSVLATLRKSLRQVSLNLLQIQKTVGSPEIIHNLEFDLVRQLLNAMSRSQPAGCLKLTGRQRVAFQRALEYIDANAKKPITVLELARASGCGVRTLEHAFRGYCGVTPKAYLKSRRLVEVRRELIQALPSEQKVSEIASRWGFWHMSQFATDYRRFFGELPSDTLNNIRN